MDVSVFFARFWGSLFIILGMFVISAKFLGRVIEYTEDKAITISTGYITFLLGLVTVIAHGIWVTDWRIAVTVLGWVTLFKGIDKIVFPHRVNKLAQKFKTYQWLWGIIIFLTGTWFFWQSIS